jgi:phage terminase large subunit-like protein
VTLLATPQPRTRRALANRAVAPLDPVTQYATDVVQGRIVAGQLVKKASQRHLDDLRSGSKRGLRFDTDTAAKAINFFPMLLRHYKGEWGLGGGLPIILEPWQAFIVGSAFGWKRLDGMRRFRDVYVEVGKKNGKTLLAAGVGLRLAFFDGEPGAEVYSAASKRDQAKLVWNDAVQMVKAAPALSKRIQRLAGNLNDPTTASKFQPLGADSDTDQGINVHGGIIDELHVHPNRDLLDNIKTASASRRQPLILKITTAGVKRESVWADLRADAVAVVEGRASDDSQFVYIATLDAGDDPFDEAVWPKANPNLGVSIGIDFLREQAAVAKRSPGAYAGYMRFHMNTPTSVSTRAIDIDEWDAGAEEPVIPEGGYCYGGLDIAATTDISAFVLVHRDELDNWNVLARFWCPEDGIDERSRRDGVPYRQWVDEGWLTATPGDMIDNDFILTEVLSLAQQYFITEIGFDSWNAFDLSVKLRATGARMFQILQTAAGLGGAWLELERAILDHRLRHGGNPVLRWMAGNVEVETDALGRQKPSKARSSEKIDGMTALTMALARLITAPEPVVWEAG